MRIFIVCFFFGGAALAESSVSTQFGVSRIDDNVILQTGLGAALSNGSVTLAASGMQLWLPAGDSLRQGRVSLSVDRDSRFQPSISVVGGNASDGLNGGGFEVGVASELSRFWKAKRATVIRLDGGVSRYVSEASPLLGGFLGAGIFQSLNNVVGVDVAYVRYLADRERISDFASLLGLGRSESLRLQLELRPVGDWVLRGGWTWTDTSAYGYANASVGIEPARGIVAGIRGGFSLAEASSGDVGIEIAWRW